MPGPEKRWKIKEEVVEFRKLGFSYNEIMRFFPLAKSTLSNWCKDIELTDSQIQRLQERKKQGSYAAGLKGSKANQQKRAKEIEQIKEQAKKEAAFLMDNRLWITGLMLYWAEGDKSHGVGVSNSDYSMILFMMRWFRKICEIPDQKFRAQLHLHSGQDETALKMYWSKITGIPISQFHKSNIKKEGTGHRKNILYNGTVKIRICDLNLLYKIQGWIKGFIDNMPA